MAQQQPPDEGPPATAAVIITLDTAGQMAVQLQGDANASRVLAAGMCSTAATLIGSAPVEVPAGPKLEIVSQMPTNGR